jgi:hypothetical protein
VGPPSETTGEVKGFAFVYSGNFLVEAQSTELGRLRMNIGINPMGMTWNLTPGKGRSTCDNNCFSFGFIAIKMYMFSIAVLHRLCV